MLFRSAFDGNLAHNGVENEQARVFADDLAHNRVKNEQARAFSGDLAHNGE